MRRLAGVLTCLMAVALIAGLAIGQPPVRTVPYQALTVDAPRSRIAVIGDSYTNGTDIGGLGPNAWPVLVGTTLARQGLPITADVAAEGRAGYGVRGDQGSIFGDLTPRAVRPDDLVVVFFGSRNDQGVDPIGLAGLAYGAFAQAHNLAPHAQLLVIGPPWPTADVPPAVLQIRDVLGFQAMVAGATFADPIAQRWFVDRPDLIGPDGVHPTDAGHAYLAAKIAPLIVARLPRSV